MTLERFEYSPIIDRPPLRWPNNARVAFWVSPNVEHYEYLPPSPGGGGAGRMLPDVRSYGNSDYGNRVGFWRLLEVLDKHKIRCTVSLNVAVLDHYPEIRNAMVKRNWDFMSHGIYNSRSLHGYTEEEERAFHRDVIETVKRQTGKQVKGMFGPAATNTERTPDLMAEAGMVYHADWFHDDQPFPLKVRSGARFISMPYTIHANDGQMGQLSYDAPYFAQLIKDQFDVLYEEGAESGRVMCVALHPHWSGRPDRGKYLDDAFGYILSHKGVWQTTADEIADYYLANNYDEMVAHLAKKAPTRR